MTAQRLLRTGWRAVGLPALVTLLLVLAGGTGAVRAHDGLSVTATAAALDDAETMPPAAVDLRGDGRPQVKRGGQWIPGTGLVAAGVPASRSMLPVEAFRTTGAAPARVRVGHREQHRGRGPPGVG